MSTETIEKIIEETQEQEEVKEPSKFQVIFHNDDKTTFDFVIYILMTVFKKTQQEAIDLTLRVHEKGSAVAGVYTFQIAEMKIDESTHLAQQAGFPLTLTAEEL